MDLREHPIEPWSPKMWSEERISALRLPLDGAVSLLDGVELPIHEVLGTTTVWLGGYSVEVVAKYRYTSAVGAP
jgi:hypothetical protein